MSHLFYRVLVLCKSCYAESTRNDKGEKFDPFTYECVNSGYAMDNLFYLTVKLKKELKKETDQIGWTCKMGQKSPKSVFLSQNFLNYFSEKHYIVIRIILS